MGKEKVKNIKTMGVKKETLERARRIYFGPRLNDWEILDALVSFFTYCESCNKEKIEEWKKKEFKKK